MTKDRRTQNNHFDALKTLLWDRLQGAIMSHYTHDAMMLAVNECWQTNHAKQLPSYRREYLRGLFEGWYRILVWHQSLDWRVFKNGRWHTKRACKYAGAETSKPFAQSVCSLITSDFRYEGCISDMGAHFWCPNGVQTDFIFTVPKPYNIAAGLKPTDRLSEDMPKRLTASQCLETIRGYVATNWPECRQEDILGTVGLSHLEVRP